VVTTSRRRTGETAEAAGLAELPSVVDDRWLEIDFGEYEGRRIAEVLAELGDEWSRDVGYAPPGGESIAAVHARVGEALDTLVDSARTESIVVVTHATPIKSAVSWALGAEIETILRLRVDLASITAFAATRRGLVMTDYNWCPARDVDMSAAPRVEAPDERSTL
jgi:broad specificity phosphatase PhoE